ncbi:hypothetical protein BSU04_21445 [Caballeronia sordidicola]|uniref:Uncharacterized protein n=1 Tax=Caballeronia sordidicola TaxID=196367 RepID=A0A226WZI0_CABSO|nr:hypothetical protein BSU04_21445 [Caballeronia sordidicola]
MVLIASAPGIFRPSGAGTKATLKIFADLIANAAVSGVMRSQAAAQAIGVAI